MEGSLSAIFSDGMVLQRDRPIPIWGKAEPGTEVSVSLGGETQPTAADKTGRWRVEFPPRPAGGPHTIRITTDSGVQTIDDVLMGDVWLCGGQSNMELPIQRVKHMFPEVLQQKENTQIRQFSVPHEYRCDTAEEMLSAGEWQTAGPDAVEDFTAVGYFFARQLNARYGVPIGLLNAAVGGTPVCAWMSRSMLDGFPEEQAQADKWAEKAAIRQAEKEEARRLEEYFAALNAQDPGLKEQWQQPDFDDQRWDICRLDELLPDPLMAPGSVWLRKKIRIPASLAGKPATLFLGTLAEADTVYLNGQKIGETEYRYPPREYPIPRLPGGEATLCIRLLNPFGDAGFTNEKFRMLVCEGKTLPLNDQWRCRRGAAANRLDDLVFYYRKPTAFYNGMIAPLHSQPICGVIWYQGESDTPAPGGYGQKLEAMIRGWRKEWEREFPFLMVQLAHYNDPSDGDWASIRRQQEEVVFSTPGTALVYGIDAGEDNDLHPQNKKLIGQRLAQAAMGIVYGETLPPSPFQLGPMFAY